MKINYFPWAEFLLFVLTCVGTLAVLFYLKISLWFFIPIALFGYFITMSDASILTLKSDHLKIASFNILIGTHTIPLKSIVTINSKQTFLDEADEVAGAPYKTLKIKYTAEYTNEKGMLKKVRFSFSNNRKEKLIMQTLTLAVSQRA